MADHIGKCYMHFPIFSAHSWGRFLHFVEEWKCFEHTDQDKIAKEFLGSQDEGSPLLVPNDGGF